MSMLNMALLDKNKVLEQAEQGNVDAQLFLGNAYYSGDIVEGGYPNFVEAAIWYQMAAEQGCPEAEFQLGTMCYHGLAGRKKGEHINYKQAAEWFCKAAKRLYL